MIDQIKTGLEHLERQINHLQDSCRKNELALILNKFKEIFSCDIEQHVIDQQFYDYIFGLQESNLDLYSDSILFNFIFNTSILVYSLSSDLSETFTLFAPQVTDFIQFNDEKSTTEDKVSINLVSKDTYTSMQEWQIMLNKEQLVNRQRSIFIANNIAFDFILEIMQFITTPDKLPTYLNYIQKHYPTIYKQIEELIDLQPTYTSDDLFELCIRFASDAVVAKFLNISLKILTDEKKQELILKISNYGCNLLSLVVETLSDDKELEFILKTIPPEKRFAAISRNGTLVSSEMLDTSDLVMIYKYLPEKDRFNYLELNRASSSKSIMMRLCDKLEELRKVQSLATDRIVIYSVFANISYFGSNFAAPSNNVYNTNFTCYLVFANFMLAETPAEYQKIIIDFLIAHKARQETDTICIIRNALLKEITGAEGTPEALLECLIKRWSNDPQVCVSEKSLFAQPKQQIAVSKCDTSPRAETQN